VENNHRTRFLIQLKFFLDASLDTGAWRDDFSMQAKGKSRTPAVRLGFFFRGKSRRWLRYEKKVEMPYFPGIHLGFAQILTR
jgi:hypothetical protein